MAIPFAFEMSNVKFQMSNLKYKISLLAALMGYIVLFSEAAEYTTYTITMTGYALWYFLEDERPLVDRILFWALFVLWCVMPIDLFCPSKLCNYIHSTLWIGVLTYTVAWVRMIYFTCKRSLRGS
jgi:FtsH-binding integral membrane protein